MIKEFKTRSSGDNKKAVTSVTVFHHFQIDFNTIQGIGRVPIVKRLAGMNPIQVSLLQRNC